MKKLFSSLFAAALMVSCTHDINIDRPAAGGNGGGEGGGSEEKEDVIIFPSDLKSLAKVYIDTPSATPVSSKEVWVELATIKILGDDGAVLYDADSLKIRGRGNSTWSNYPKKPYNIKLQHQANFFGTGKSKRWVLIANWMDRTLLRNDVAYEAARRTSLEWTPSGEFVELYLNGSHLGNYWLGEKINVEGSKFTADYLYTFDTSNGKVADFTTTYGYRKTTSKTGLPAIVKYPDRDDYLDNSFNAVISAAKTELNAAEESIYRSGTLDKIDIDSFCDWFIVHELCYNMEPKHPKSCFVHSRDGILYAGPVWDFDWTTFTPDHTSLELNSTFYFPNVTVGSGRNAVTYNGLWSSSSFKSRLKERWRTLKPEFETLGEYIDKRSDQIRASEAVNHSMWPCYPNPLSEDGTGMVNHDERMSFDEAVARMKSALNSRISAMDTRIEAL